MIYAYAAVGIAAFAAGGLAAWNIQNWRFDSAELERVEQTREVEKMRRQAAGKAATAHEKEKVVIREKFLPVREEVERVVIQYRDSVCLPADGLRVIQNAIDRANGTAGEPRNAVPGSAATP